MLCGILIYLFMSPTPLIPSSPHLCPRFSVTFTSPPLLLPPLCLYLLLKPSFNSAFFYSSSIPSPQSPSLSPLSPSLPLPLFPLTPS